MWVSLTEQELDTKQKIVEATIQLIREKMDVKKITIRGIAKRAGITKSMINYHFQSKEKLINQAVQSFISTVISKGDAKFREIEMMPEERLRTRVKQAAGFLALNPGISRVSILGDLRDGNEHDNSSQSLQSIFVQLKDIYGDKKNEVCLKIKTQQLLASIQEIFLRASVFKQQTGIDYYNDEQRNKLVDIIIDNVLNDYRDSR